MTAYPWEKKVVMDTFFKKQNESLLSVSRLKVILQIYHSYFHLFHQHKILFALISKSCKYCYSWKNCFNCCFTVAHMLFIFIETTKKKKKWVVTVVSLICTDIDCRFAVGKCVNILYSEFLNVIHLPIFNIYSLKMKHWIDALLMTAENSFFTLKKMLSYMKDILNFALCYFCFSQVVSRRFIGQFVSLYFTRLVLLCQCNLPFLNYISIHWLKSQKKQI